MYETEQLIFVQMQKTGSTHIAKILAEIFKGPPPNEGKGKHSRATENQRNSGKIILSSIRNPWDWYVSLWAFGCSGKGGLRNRVVENNKERTNTEPKDWEAVYADKNDTGLFREWLHMLLDPLNKSLIHEDFGSDDLARNRGFMTYRYMRLCWKDPQRSNAFNHTRNDAQLIALDQSKCYINDFIRLESLEDELCRVINKIRPLSKAEKTLIHNADPTNASPRSDPLHMFYDYDTIQTVRRNDGLIIRKFDYHEPQ
jgi:hypothetical protein